MIARPDRWLLGLPALFAIWIGAVWQLAPALEHSLRNRLLSGPNAGIAAELARHGGRFEIRGRDAALMLEGELAPDLRRRALAAASLPGVRRLATDVDTPIALVPFRFSVARGPDGARMSGGAPPGSARADLVEAAEAAFGSGRVDQDLRSALGAPDGFDAAARQAIAFAATLPVGSVTLTGRSLAFAGEAADIVSYEAAMRIARAPPPGYTVASLGIVPPLVQPFTWSVAREGGSLVLGGLVPSDAAREAVLKAAAAASDGGEVVDRTHVARGLDPALSFDRMAELSLDWIRRFDGGAVRLDGRVLSVEGRTGARDLVPGIERDIRRAPLFGAELGRVAISAVPPSPYWFGAKRAGGRLVLRGYLPAEADRAAILDIAGRRFPTEALVNNLHLADGAPAGIRHAAELGLLALSSLAEGETSLRDASLKLAGRALYPQYAARTREAVSGGVPAGWAAAVDIKVVPENPLDSTACADLLAEQVRREPVRFEPGSAELGPSARKALERLAGVIRRCGERRIRVTGRVETAGDIEPARELATRRAAAIVAALAPAEITAALEPAGIAARAGGRPPAEADAVAFEVLP